MLLLKSFTIQNYSRRSLAVLGGTIICLWLILTLHFGQPGYLSRATFGGIKSQNSPKYAYATILTAEGDVEYPDVQEPYLKAARLLTYQLLHNPVTRNSTEEIPFLVLVTPDIPQRHRDILAGDGATIVPVQSLQREWIHPKWGRWGDVLAKLNLWKQVDYEKIAFLDADSVIFRPLHDIFNIPSTEILESSVTNTTVMPQFSANTTGTLPDDYMIAGIHDLWMEQYMKPEEGKEFYKENNYFNAGFFVFHPSMAVYDYYVALLDSPGSFDSAYPEQNLLNCAHRTDGPIPWKELGSGWNSKFARQGDYEKGLRSIHQKWWRKSPDQFLNDRVAEKMAELEEYLQRNQTTTA